MLLVACGAKETPTAAVEAPPTSAPAAEATPIVTPTPEPTSPGQPSEEVLAEAPTEPPMEPPTEVPAATPTQVPAEKPAPKGPPASASLGDTLTRPADGMVMVYVPAGEFEMGSTELGVDEEPVHTVALDAFWIDQMEVTNAQYRQCMEARACEEPGCWDEEDLRAPEQPVVCVTWYQAQAYCEWAGGWLPTEAEWEYAARGPEGWRYPWGDEFDGTRLNYCDANCDRDYADKEFDDGYAYTASVGSFPAGASWCGALDLAGNVFELVADWYDGNYYSRSPSRNPTGPSSGERRVSRGGSWHHVRDLARSENRNMGNPGASHDSVGFRCVSRYSPPAAVVEPTPSSPTQGPSFNVEELVARLCGYELYGDEICGRVVIIDPSLPGALDFYEGLARQFYGLSLQDYLALVQGAGDLPAHNPNAGESGKWTQYSCPDAGEVTILACLAEQVGDPVCALDVDGNNLTSSCDAAIAVIPANGTTSLDGSQPIEINHMYEVYAHPDLRILANLNDQDGFRGVLLAVAQPAPAAAVEPTPSPTQGPSFNVEELIARLCRNETSNDVCGHFVIFDPTQPGALDFYENLIQDYYGISLADYLELVRGVGDLPARNTGQWSDYSCPDANTEVTILACMAEQVENSVCSLEVQGSDLASSCTAVAAIIPPRDTPTLDGSSQFQFKYMPDVYAHGDVRVLGSFRQDDFHGVLLAVAQPAPAAAAVEPTVAPTPQGTYPLDEFITPRASVWGIEINDPSFDPNAYTYADILYALQQEGLVPQWMDLNVYQAIMDAGSFVTFSHLHAEYNETSGLFYTQDGTSITIIAIGNAATVYPDDPTPTPQQMDAYLDIPVETTFIRPLGGGTDALYAVTQGILEDITD
jgi:formylglycine-generating enzyme required for sulfatase activity